MVKALYTSKATAIRSSKIVARAVVKAKYTTTKESIKTLRKAVKVAL